MLRKIQSDKAKKIGLGTRGTLGQPWLAVEGGDWAGSKKRKYHAAAPVWAVSNQAGRPIGSATHCLVICGGTDADGRTVSAMESEHSVRSECDVAVAVALGGRELR